MTHGRTRKRWLREWGDALSRATASTIAGEIDPPTPQADTTPPVLVVDADATLFCLIDEWLGNRGYRVLREADPASGAAARAGLVILDLPYPRPAMWRALRKVAVQHPHVPVIALSSTFFPGVAREGTVAQSLGVAAVIAKPLQQDSFVAAVNKWLPLGA